jgi:hypothetical protein
MKINFSKEVKMNLSAMNQYTVMLKKEKLATYFVLAPILGLLAAFLYYQLKAGFALWIFLIVILGTALVLEYWLYKRLYDTNIQAIKHSLDEMKEWEEEDAQN